MSESVSRLWEMVTQSTGQLTTGELILRVALIGCSLFATLQLMWMLVTRYGDNNATSKSLFLSLLLHCCFALGWVTAVSQMPAPSGVSGSGPAQAPVSITLAPGDGEGGEGSAEGDLPGGGGGWGTPRPREATLTRHSRPGQEMPSVEIPAAETTPSERVVTEAPNLAANVEVPEVTPDQQEVANAPVLPARATTEIDQPIPASRKEVTISAAGNRQKVARAPSSTDLVPRIQPQRAPTENVGTLIDDGAVLTLPDQVIPEISIPIPNVAGTADAKIPRRGNTPVITGDVADADSSPAAPATANQSRPGKFTRAGSRNGSDSSTEAGPSAPASRPAIGGGGSRDPQLVSRITLGSSLGSPLGSELGVGNGPSPELARIESGPSMSRPPTRDPETYKMRRIDDRRAGALKNGGSEGSERAVEASLKWMASIQDPAGNWSSAQHGGGQAKTDPQGQNRLGGGLHADSGITGLVVLSYLGAGYTHEEGKYADVVRRALKWLIGQQQSNGYLGGKATRYDMMYCHAMATFALAEAYGMQGDANAFPELRDAVQGGVKLICAMQNEDGGWRYGKGGDSDMSMFGWQLMALKSAVHAGIPVPDEARRGMAKFLQARALGTKGGLAGYKLNEAASPAMTAEALFCRQMFGIRQSDPATQEAVTYLGRHLPRLSNYDEYYWYYGTLAMFQHGGKPWEEWNDSLRDTLVGLQRTQGPLAGSWDPNGKWAGIGGRLYSTAVSTMCLEVYTRYLRIYQSEP